jgi:hypothetical protein
MNAWKTSHLHHSSRTIGDHSISLTSLPQRIISFGGRGHLTGEHFLSMYQYSLDEKGQHHMTTHSYFLVFFSSFLLTVSDLQSHSSQDLRRILDLLFHCNAWKSPWEE